MLRFGHVEFEMPSRYPRRNVKQTAEFMNLEERGPDQMYKFGRLGIKIVFNAMIMDITKGMSVDRKLKGTKD